MALKKTIDLDSGATAEYHKIGSVYNNRVTGQINLEVYSYLTAEARQANKACAKVWSWTYYQKIEWDGMLSALYDYLKTLPEWADAIDA